MDETRARILAAAMEEAERSGWYDLRLHQVADHAGVSLAELRALFRDADAIADAWFEAALAAMLATHRAEVEGFGPARRVEIVLMRWFAH